MDIFPVERCDERLVQFDQNLVRHVVATGLDLLDPLHGGGHLLVIVVVQQVGQNLGAFDYVVRDLREHIEELGLTWNEAHDGGLLRQWSVGDSTTCESRITRVLKFGETGNYRMSLEPRSNRSLFQYKMSLKEEAVSNTR